MHEDRYTVVASNSKKLKGIQFKSVCEVANLIYMD